MDPSFRRKHQASSWPKETLDLKWPWQLPYCQIHGVIPSQQSPDFVYAWSYILQPLDVSCFGPPKKAYGFQIVKKLGFGINHVNKVGLLPAFLTAHQLAMTRNNIISGFWATGLVPFDPDQVLSQLRLVIQATPPKSSQSFWEPKTPKTSPKVKKQGYFILTQFPNRRISSASSGEKRFQQLLKGFETGV